MRPDHSPHSSGFSTRRAANPTPRTVKPAPNIRISSPSTIPRERLRSKPAQCSARARARSTSGPAGSDSASLVDRTNPILGSLFRFWACGLVGRRDPGGLGLAELLDRLVEAPLGGGFVLPGEDQFPRGVEQRQVNRSRPDLGLRPPGRTSLGASPAAPSRRQRFGGVPRAQATLPGASRPVGTSTIASLPKKSRTISVKIQSRLCRTFDPLTPGVRAHVRGG